MPTKFLKFRVFRSLFSVVFICFWTACTPENSAKEPVNPKKEMTSTETEEHAKPTPLSGTNTIPKPTNQNLSQVQTNMSEADILNLLGEPLRRETRVMGSTEAIIFAYPDNQGYEVELVFIGDRLVSKSGRFAD